MEITNSKDACQSDTQRLEIREPVSLESLLRKDKSLALFEGAADILTNIRLETAKKRIRHDYKPVEIIQGLYLGSIGAALNKKLLKDIGITHILCICDSVKSAFPKDFVYKIVPVEDGPETQIKDYFEECAEFIDTVLADKKKVLVHCFSGKSRSVAIVAAYLIKSKNMSKKEALELIKTKRPSARPNFDQLKDYEKEKTKSSASTGFWSWFPSIRISL